MIEEPFATGRGWIHRLDPTVKIIAGMILSMEIAVAERFSTLTTAGLLAALLILTARLPLAPVLKRLSVLAGFMLLMWGILPLTYEGEPFHQYGPLIWTRPGIMLSTRITLKSVTILMIFMALLSTMPIAALGRGLNRLRVPDKLVFLFLMTYRYIFVMEDEYRRLARAAKIRGFRPGTNLHSYQTYAYLIGMLFVRAKRRADRVYQAMRCRGFSGKFHTIQTLQSNPALQLIFSVAMLSAGVLLGGVEWVL
ncbi:MAG: cobalt ECF transporter T component CbiQ [Thermodesulfobacteriota bacterium]